MTLTIDLSPQEESRFTDYARQRGLDPAMLARILLTASLPALETSQEQDTFGGKSVADLVEEIGAVEGLPSDLSTNPQHMMGFGNTNDRPT